MNHIETFQKLLKKTAEFEDDEDRKKCFLDAAKELEKKGQKA